jgi:hypothetical protein
LPVPVAPLVTVIQVALLTVAQVQPVVVVTAALAVPAAAAIDWVVGNTVNAQGALCVTVSVRPAIVSVPVRSTPAFAVTE